MKKARESEVAKILEKYVKILLYTYPLLKSVGKDYEEHIRNKALLSYNDGGSAESLAEYLAEEILCQRKLWWLKEKIEEALDGLSDLEKVLVEIRYFGKKRKIRQLLFSQISALEKGKNWSERKYFRKQEALGKKLGELLAFAGVTKKVAEEELLSMDIFGKVKKFVETGKDGRAFEKEKKFLA